MRSRKADLLILGSRDTVQVGKMPSRKADLFTLGSRDTVCRYLLSVAMILCNKMDFSFGAN